MPSDATPTPARTPEQEARAKQIDDLIRRGRPLTKEAREAVEKSGSFDILLKPVPPEEAVKLAFDEVAVPEDSIFTADQIVATVEAITGVDIRGKPTNPKDAVGIAKVPFSTIPQPVMAMVGLAMMEGARKYGRHNYRSAGIRASVYFDALMRHMTAWWEGEDIDPDSGLPHPVKAIATLAVLMDCIMSGNIVDDRPPEVHDKTWLVLLNQKAQEIIKKYPEAKEAFTNGR